MTAPLRALDLARATSPALVLQDQVRAGMAQLSPYGLSEDWVLRDCGDRHWALIAQATGLTGTAFHDAEGHPIYAAFCTTSLRFHPPDGSLLGQEFTIRSTLYEVGANRLGSEHVFSCGGRDLGRLAMISTFLRHDATGSNHKMLRSRLPNLQRLPEATASLQELARQARETARQVRGQGAAGEECLHLTPVPGLDFNAAGLLYFPSYSRFTEMAMPQQGALLGRDIVYLGNLEMGEALQVYRQGRSAYLTTESGRMMAVVRTLDQASTSR